MLAVAVAQVPSLHLHSSSTKERCIGSYGCFHITYHVTVRKLSALVLGSRDLVADFADSYGDSGFQCTAAAQREVT